MPRPVPKPDFDPFTLEDLVIAYRHTKAELFAEKSIPSRLELLSYEEDLIGNLTVFLNRLNRALRSEVHDWFTSEAFLGKILRQPKEVATRDDALAKTSGKEPHLYITDAVARWEAFKNTDRPQVDFRTMAVPSIDFQILSMLWIMEAGHLLDAGLSPACRGNRLKRVSDNSDLGRDRVSPLNNDSPQIFRPYHYAYRKWRRDGLTAIEGEVELDRRVVAITMDLKRYYHRIDSVVLANDALWRNSFGIELDSRQQKLTELLTSALVAWAAQSPEKTGIPVGLLASRLIGNALLHEFDNAVSVKINPVFYARYVDDILLVIRPPTELNTAKGIIGFIADELCDLAQVQDDGVTLILCLQHTGKSVLEFGASKQRIFDFKGTSGKDLLKTINREIDELSSEFRLMPDVSEEDGSVLKHALVADHDVNIGADSLRKADSLTIRRLGLAILLRNHEMLERCVSDPKEWESIRVPFYKLIEEHVLTPERYCMYFQYLPRIFGLITANGDWKFGERLLERIDWVQREMEALDQNAPTI